jgi:hypothetical protein
MVCRTTSLANISVILVGTYSDVIEQWESIPLDLQTKDLAIHMDRINTIRGPDRKSRSGTRLDPETGMDDDDVLLLMYIVYIRFMIYYWNTIGGKFNNFSPRVNGFKIRIPIAISATHV